MGKILPILIVLIGVAAGGGAGMFFRSAPVEVEVCVDDGRGSCDEPAEDSEHSAEIEPDPNNVTM